MKSVSIITAALATLMLATPVLAQQVACFNNNRAATRPEFAPPPQPDYVSSDTWARLPQYPDPRAAQLLSGTWYSENRNPQGGQVQYMYQSFEPNGLFQYRDQTCSAYSCSNNQGTGYYRAVMQGDGSVFMMVNFSDLVRSNQCVSNQLRFQDAGTMITRDGGILRRVQ